MSGDLLGIGASGTRAYQAAMGVISNNITNAETPGYARRTLALMESPSGPSTSIFYRSTTSYGSVMINQVMRSSDPFLDAAARQTANMLGSADQRARWMADIETALNDGPLGVGQRMSAMFSAVEKLAANPTDTTLRTDVLFAFEQINTAFKQSLSELNAVREGIGQSANNETAALNSALKQLADANEGLRRSDPGSAAHVALMDSRDQALDEISKRLNVTVEYTANDAVKLSYGSTVLVENVTAQQIGVAQDADGLLTFEVVGPPSVALDAPTGGTLGGLVTSASVNKDRIDSLNGIAAQYVADINAWHAQGQTASGTPGAPLLSMGADASTLQVLISDPAQIAGASSSGVPNGNLLAINDLRGTGSFEDKWTALISTHANVLSATLAEQTNAQSRHDMAEQAKADVSGVNLDREAADLIRLQQAYNGSARIIQVARELLDTIFAIF